MTNNLKKQNIEAIFPITSTQQKLLFHSLTSSFDQGFLNLQCSLGGAIDLAIFEEAWNIAVLRHAVMRTTVHWEKIEKPVQIVHKKKSIALVCIDLKNSSSANQEKRWGEILDENRKNGVDFSKGALLQVKLVQFKINTYRLLWTNHHLLVDGWSSNNVLKDVFYSYEALLSKNVPSFEPIPSYKSYLKWLTQNKPENAQIFWESYFDGKINTNLFESGNASQAQSITVENALTAKETEDLKEFAKQSKVTLNILIQSIWSLVLFKYFNVTEATHGTTVSGRTADFKNIELLSGMYSKVHPIRNFIEGENELLSEWFEKIQRRQLKASQYEYLDLEQILSFTDLGANPSFDSLFIFENFPVVDSDSGSVVVSNFKSGITSTYPVTMVVVPGKELHTVLTVSGVHNEVELAEWLSSTFIKIIRIITSKEVKLVTELLAKIADVKIDNNVSIHSPQDQVLENYLAPRTDLEKQLVTLWEDVFEIKRVGILDDFFALGGKSLIAVKMFTKLSEEYQIKLPPTTLLEHPTIKKIASLITGGDPISTAGMEFIVPLRASGTKAPLFCIHAGGGHVFFYNDLAKSLSQDRPVYALQPSGIDGQNKMHNSISEMTGDYLREIKQIQPKGPYHILAYCFGTAVGIEMIRQLEKTNEMAHIIIMDTMALQEKKTNYGLVMRTDNFIKRFSQNPLKSLFIMVSDRTTRYLKPIWVQFFGSEDDKNLEALKQNLIVIYKKYEWRKFKGQIDLLITKKATESLNNAIIESWEKLTDDVVITLIEGNHRTLFEETDVQLVSKSLEQTMVSYESK